MNLLVMNPKLPTYSALNRKSASNKQAQTQREVKIGIQFDRIGEIDTMNERFYAELIIESQWREDSIIETYDEKVHWNPKLYIENKLNELKEHSSYTIDFKDDYCLVVQKRVVRGLFWIKQDLRNFPIDLQRLTITVMSARPTNEVKLVRNKKQLYYNSHIANTFIDQQKWHLYALIEVSESVVGDRKMLRNMKKTKDPQEMQKTRIQSTCCVSRQPAYYLWNAFFLIFLITGTALNTFTVDVSLVNSRLQGSFTILLTSVQFKWVVNRATPIVGYLTSLDQYGIVHIFFLAMLAIWHSIAGSISDVNLARQIDKWVLLGFGTVFLTIQLVFAVILFNAYRSVLNYVKREKIFFESFQNKNGEFDD